MPQHSRTSDDNVRIPHRFHPHSMFPKVYYFLVSQITITWKISLIHQFIGKVGSSIFRQYLQQKWSGKYTCIKVIIDLLQMFE